MSMIGNLVAVREELLQSFISDPEQIEHFLYPADGDAAPENHLDLDKAWHAIHFTLNGQAWEGEEPLFFTILGGQEIGEDVGYGPVRYLTPAQVNAVSIALAAVTPENFSSKFNAPAMTAAEIYPEIWEEEGAESLEYVLPFYNDLLAFYQAAAKRGDAMLLYLN